MRTPFWVGALALCALLAMDVGAQEPQPTPRQRLAQIQSEYKAELAEFEAAYKAAKDAGRPTSFENYPSADRYAERLRALAAEAPADPVLGEATNWLLNYSAKSQSVVDELLGVLVKAQVDNPVLAETCQWLESEQSPASRRFLQALRERSPHAEVRGRACYALAKQLSRESSAMLRLRRGDEPWLEQELSEDLGAERVAALRGGDPEPVRAEAIACLEEVVGDYADLSAYRGTLGARAKADLFELRHLQPGMTAPEIAGVDVDGIEFKLSDYRGKVVFLDFWGFW